MRRLLFSTVLGSEIWRELNVQSELPFRQWAITLSRVKGKRALGSLDPVRLATSIVECIDLEEFDAKKSVLISILALQHGQRSIQ